MVNFEHTGFLWGLLILLPLGVLFFLVIRWKAKVKHAIGDEALVNELTKTYSSRLYRWKFIIVLLALLLAILAAANLRKPAAGNEEKRAGIDIMIALDVSKSMLSQDVKPTRLDKAKQFISQLMDQADDNRIGLIVFAGKAFLQMPLTSDLAAAKIFISNASTDAVPMQGTVIADALRLCGQSLNTKEKKYKAVILITDGEDHDPNAAAAAKELYDQGVVVYTVGVGTAQGSPILDPVTNNYKTDQNGQTVISKLNESELENIAKNTGGKYYHLENSVTVANELSNELNGMDKKLFEAGNGGRQYNSFFPFFIAIALVLLVVEIFIPETKKLKG